jgi:hypothetical protein
LDDYFYLRRLAARLQYAGTVISIRLSRLSGRSSTSIMFSSVLIRLAVAGWVCTSFAPIVSGGPTSAFDLFPRTPAAGIDVKTLAPKLSPNAKIYLPGTKEFATYTTRWSNLEAPTPNIVVAPGTEKDVQKIVSSFVDVFV